MLPWLLPSLAPAPLDRSSGRLHSYPTPSPGTRAVGARPSSIVLGSRATGPRARLVLATDAAPDPPAGNVGSVHSNQTRNAMATPVRFRPAWCRDRDHRERQASRLESARKRQRRPVFAATGVTAPHRSRLDTGCSRRPGVDVPMYLLGGARCSARQSCRPVRRCLANQWHETRRQWTENRPGRIRYQDGP
jgi:hypothetical protein